MPTIVDSLFLELGVDTSRFSKDQRAALEKIQQFEGQAKRSSGKAADSIKTVGDAFRDLAKDSRVGSSAAGIDNLATKLKNLGVSAQVAGGVGAPLGMMAQGIGTMLSPAALGAAAVGLLAKETWDFNRSMTESNATLARNAQLSGMSAASLWAMGQAAKTVGGNAEGVEASIAGLQTALAGMSVGVGSAVPQLIGMARLRKYGAKYNPGGFGNGVDEESLFQAVSKMSQSQGKARTMAMVTQYGLMNQDQAALAMSANGWKEYQNAKAKAEAMKTGGGFEAVVRNSLKSQVGLGEKDIAGAITAETAYGGIQQPMQTIVGLLTNIYAILNATLGFVAKIAGFSSSATKDGPKTAFNIAIEGAKAAFGAVANTLRVLSPIQFGDSGMRSGMSKAMQLLMGNGMSKSDAAAMVGSMAQESSMNPFARNGSHVGLMQLDKSRQADFAKWAGYQIGSLLVSKDKQFNDQVLFGQYELHTTQKKAAEAMARVQDLMGKTKAFMDLDERPGPGDNSLSKRLANAVLASRLNDVAGLVQAANARSTTAQHSVTSETHIGDVILNTNATDPASHAAAFRDGISKQPLVDPSALVALSLSTRGMAL